MTPGAAKSGLLGTSKDQVDVEAAIRMETRLSAEQKDALITVYRTYLDANSKP